MNIYIYLNILYYVSIGHMKNEWKGVTIVECLDIML